MMINSREALNAVLKKQPMEGKKFSFHSHKALVGLAVLSALSMGSCIQKASELGKVRSENQALKADLTHLRQENCDLFLENQDLKEYKMQEDEAEPFYPEVSEGNTEDDTFNEVIEEILPQADSNEVQKGGINISDVLRLSGGRAE